MLQKKCDYFKNGGFCQSNYDSMYLESRDTTTNTSLSAVPALRNPPITRPADVGRGYIARNGARACAGGADGFSLFIPPPYVYGPLGGPIRPKPRMNGDGQKSNESENLH